MRIKDNFDLVTVNRRDIHGAPYNPRTISETAKKNLKKSLTKYGVIDPISVNKTTMNIVSGHQRLALLDADRGKEDYELKVLLTDLTQEEEIKANILMNNPSAQGDYDIDALADIKFMLPDVNYVDDLGFDAADLRVMFAGTGFSEAVGDGVATKEEMTEAERIAHIDNLKEAKQKERDMRNPDNVERDYQEKGVDNLLTIVFNSNTEKHEFMQRIHKKQAERFIKPAVIYDIQTGKYTPFGLQNKE